MGQPEVIIVTEARLPAGDAAAHRIRAISSSLSKTGLRVAVIGRGDDSARLPLGTADNIAYHLWYAGRAPHERLHCAIEHCFGERIINHLKSLAGWETRVIICDHGGIPFLHRLFGFARRFKLRVVMDVTEWWYLTPRKGMPLSFLPLVFEHFLRYRYTYTHPKRLITASQALSDFYRSRGCEVFRLPPLLDLSEERWSIIGIPHNDDAMHILFAGSPDRERWDVILQGLIEANRQGIPVVLEVLGVPRERFERVMGAHRELLTRCRNRVVFHGRVPSEEVAKIIAGAHLGILVRDDASWSRGCFPSKVPELLALGVPVMFNPTGDLDEYLHDGVEGIRICAPTLDCLLLGLRRAWELLQNGCWEKLRHSARQRARASFDCLIYANPLRTFLGL